MNFLKGIILKKIKKNYGTITYFSSSSQKNIFDLINKIRKERTLLLSDHEAYQIFVTAQAAGNLDGDMAEIGVYEGASTKIILEAVRNSGKKVYTFDTFSGLPDDDEFHNMKKGDYASSYERFTDYLSEYKNLVVKKGFFPDTAKGLEKNLFAFVHIDTDLYKATFEALSFFYPRLSKGGIIISHDYLKNAGVRKAFDDFCKIHNYPYVLEVAGTTQGIVFKM